MNPHETKTNGALVDAAPLFASVWLALFNELRRNYYERRLMSAVSAESLQVSAIMTKQRDHC